MQPRGAGSDRIDRIDITDVGRALRRDAEAVCRPPKDGGIRLLDSLLVRVEHELEVVGNPQLRQQRIDPPVTVADDGHAHTPLPQATERLEHSLERHAPQVGFGVPCLDRGDHGADGQCRNSGRLEHVAKVPGKARRVRAHDGTFLARLGVDRLARRGLTVQQRLFADDDVEPRSRIDNECVVDANEGTAGVEQDCFEDLGEQVSAPIAHGRQVWQLASVRVLVTGASGFVGGHLIPRLEAEGHTVTATDLDLDVTDAVAVEARIAAIGPEAIVHLAAVSSVAFSWKNPGLTYRVNYVGTRSLLEAVRRRAPKARVLLVSSADVYGSAKPGTAPFDETSPLRPRSPYSRSKAAADLLAGVFADRGVDVLRVRPFNHTGRGQTDAFVLPSFARQVAAIEAGRAEPVLRVGNLESVRDFLDIQDVIDAYVLLLETPVPADVYNVSSGVGVKIAEAIRILCELAGIDPRIEVNPDFYRPTDIAVGSATHLQAASGWRPRVPFRLTLESLLDDWRGRLTSS